MFQNNPNQISWQYVKVEATPGDQRFQEFLDSTHYSRHGILSYEQVHGRNYLSAGGESVTHDFVARLKLNPGLMTTMSSCWGCLNLNTDEYVLDVGTGLGGSAFHMAEVGNGFRRFFVACIIFETELRGQCSRHRSVFERD